MPLRRFLLFLIFVIITLLAPLRASAQSRDCCTNPGGRACGAECRLDDDDGDGYPDSGHDVDCYSGKISPCNVGFWRCNFDPDHSTDHGHCINPNFCPAPFGVCIPSPTPTRVPPTVAPPAPTNPVPMDNFRPLRYPCNRIAEPEFHPLRPYPGSPCDPLIPRKVPEAPASTDPEKMYLTYFCGKSLNVSGTDQTFDVVRICGLDVIPSPIPLPYDDFPGIDSNEMESPRYRCDTTTTDICYLKKIVWDLEYDFSATQLPIMGNTEIGFSDVVKVNSYLSWYLNGTIFQAEQMPLVGTDPADSTRITTYSGPLNKLIPKLWSDELKHTLYSNNVGTDYHDYLVACQKNIDFAYVRDALIQLLTSIFGNIFDVIHIVGILLSNGWEFIGEVGSALTDIYRAIVNGTIHIPPGSGDVAQAAQIFLGHGLTVLGNNLGDIETLLNLGRDIINNIGSVLQAFSLDFIESCSTSDDERRLSYMATHDWERGLPYVPYSTLEDTTGEVTTSVIMANQPTSPDIDGTILSVSLWIDAPSDSRLYFPHLRAALALSEMISGTYRPIMTPTPAVSSLDQQLVSQKITQHQGQSWIVPGGSDNTIVQIAREYPNSLRITRNTEVRENAPAPTPLYNADKLCDLVKVRTNRGDTLKPGPDSVNKSINATLTYFQLVRYTPRLAIQCAGVACPPCGSDTCCVNDPCLNMEAECNITDKICCTDELAPPNGGYDGVEGNCPFDSECQHADADFYCVPGNPGPPPSSGECDDDPANGVYVQLYNYSCDTRDGPAPHRVCCGPQEDPVYDEYCEPSIACLISGNPWRIAWCQANCPTFNYANCVLNSDCHWYSEQLWGGHTIVPDPPFCPAWLTRDVRSAARTNVFTKTPIIEKLYNLLIVEPQSLLRRWLPKLPLSATSSSTIKTGKNNTIPASSSVRYIGTTENLENTRTTAGRGGSGTLYFPHLGSLSDYLLGWPNGENLNLQRLLRPKGFIGPVGMEPTAGGDANCNTNLPEQSVACVDKANYIDIASRWYGAGDPGQPNAEKCFDDVVYRANAAGVNPGLALLAWINECDTSNYASEGSCWDFGMVFEPQNDFSAQIDAYLEHINFIRSSCAYALNAGVDPVEVYASRYITRYCTLAEILTGGDASYYGYVQDYIDGMNQVWGYIDGGCAFPFP